MKLFSRSFQHTVWRKWKQVMLGVFVLGALVILLLPNTVEQSSSFPGFRRSISSSLGSFVGWDPRVSALKSLMVQPSPIITYNLTHPNKEDFSRGQSRVIDDLLQKKENGYFVDIGAGDGETNSVTLFFERRRYWQGVLIEANNWKFRQALTKNRQCILWHVRLNLDDNAVTPLPDNEMSIQEMFTLLNRTRIDLLSINLNGREYDVLSAIDLVLTRISIITVEMPNDVSRERYFKVTNYLLSKGYTVAHHLIYGDKKDIVYTYR